MAAMKIRRAYYLLTNNQSPVKIRKGAESSCLVRLLFWQKIRANSLFFTRQGNIDGKTTTSPIIVLQGDNKRTLDFYLMLLISGGENDPISF